MNFRNFYLVEGKMPPGFTQADIETTDEFLKSELGEAVIDEKISDAEVSDVDIDALKKRRLDPSKFDKMDLGSRPEKMLHKSNIVDENGKEIDNDILRKKLTVRPKILIAQNSKLGKSGSNQAFYDFTLPSYQGLYVDETSGEFKVVKTCPAAGDCKKFCYAAKGGYIQFPASSLNASRVVTFMMNDYDGFKAQLLSEINAAVAKIGKKDKTLVLRWHDSGDFISENYLLMAFEIAKATPNVLHYAYTKMVPMVKKLESNKPKNFIFNFSLGGLHDDQIDTTKDRHARVVPAELFKDIDYTRGEDGYSVIFAPKELAELKKRVAEHYKIDPKTLINYDELMKLPVSTTQKYNVLVYKGHGDDAAARADVLGIYLLFH